MDKKIFKYCVIGFIFVSILGSLSHFCYEWSGNNRIVALFCPVNESTWEHMKLLFFPSIYYTIFFSCRCKEYTAVTASMLLGNILGIFLIPVLFYSYSGIYGKNVAFIDIAIFYVSAAIVFYLAYYWIVRQKRKEINDCRCIIYWRVEKYETLLIIISSILALCFFVFTFYPPSWGIFQPPE